MENCKKKLKNGKSCFNLIHINIRSISKIFDEFQTIMIPLELDLDLIVLLRFYYGLFRISDLNCIANVFITPNKI